MSQRDTLMHFGVLGQKWGVRRWQYPDGSLTPEGRTHYGLTKEKANDFNGDIDKSIRQNNSLLEWYGKEANKAISSMSKKDKDAMLSKAADALEPYLDREANGEAWIYFDDENLKDCLFRSVSDYLKKKGIVYPYEDHNKNVDKAKEMLSSYVEHTLGDIGNTKIKGLYNNVLKDNEVKELLYKFDDDYDYKSYFKLNPNSYSFGVEMMDIINSSTEDGSIYLENDFEEELRKRKVYEYD